MNSKHLLLAISLATLTLLSSTVQAESSTSTALSACKDHIAKIHESEDLRRKVKRIRERRNDVEIKVNVVADGERFKAVCVVSNEGELSYTTDQSGEMQYIASED